jgi:hypothetical protein
LPEVRPHLAFEGAEVKVYNATYSGGNEATKTVPVAAQSLQHAARKADKEAGKSWELVKVELTKDIII